MQRVRSLGPSIVEELSTSSPDRLRRIAIAAAAAAVERAQGSPPLLTRAVADLRRGVLDDAAREAVTKLASELDDRYLDLQDDEKPGGRSPGWENAFVLARAAAAVAYAFDPDPAVAAGEAVYECSVAIDDAPSLLAIVTATKYLT